MADCGKFRFIEWTGSLALEQKKHVNEKGESYGL